MADFNEFDQGGGFKSLDSNDVRRLSSPIRGRIISMINRLSEDDASFLFDKLRETPGGTTLIQQSDLESIDRKYGLSGEFSFSNMFKLGPQGSSPETVQSTESLKAHLGARRRSSFAKATIASYTDRLSDGTSQGDIVYMTNTSPCPKFNKSNSPYEKVKKIWEGGLKKDMELMGATEGSLDLGLSARLNFLPEGTRQRVAEMFKAAYEAGIENGGEFERESYKNGRQVPIDLGSLNGSYSRNPAVATAPNEAERRRAINDSFKPFEMPNAFFNLLQDTDDLSKKIDPEYASLTVEYYLDGATETIQQMIDEYQTFKNLSSEEQKRQLENGGIFSKDVKKGITIFYASGLGVLELYKLGKISELGKGFTEGLGSHSTHFISQVQGVIEIVAGLYKVMYYIDHGKYKDAATQAGLSVISAIAEFAPTKTLELAGSLIGGRVNATLTSFLARFGGLGVYGGYVGLGITAVQLTQEFIIKPIAKSKFIEQYPNVLDELLDLERQQIEKECCTNIHPELYRNSKGQISVLMSPDGFIPFGREYKRTVRGESESLNSIPEPVAGARQPGPCESNGQIPLITTKRYIKVLSSQDSQFLGRLPSNMAGPPEEPVYIVDPRESEDPCKKKEIIVRPETGGGTTTPSEQEGGDFGDTGTEYVKDRTAGHTAFWSPNQEKNLQDATVQYNRAYTSDVYKFKIDSAKCKTGEIQNPQGQSSNYFPEDRDGFQPLAGLSGMTAGYYRIGTTIIARQIFETSNDQATIDSSAAGRDTSRTFWNGQWEVTTREYGFNVGGGGAGTGTKLRGITSFFYDPLNPPKPIRQV